MTMAAALTELLTTGAPKARRPLAGRPIGFSHVAMMTADLDRFRAFYEDVLGLSTSIVLKLDHPPYLRHAFLFVDDRTVLHVFEEPGYDPVAAGIGTEIGRRGRIDHFGLMVRGSEELEAVRQRLVAAGASDGTVTPLGPVLSVHFVDPDGLHGEINAFNDEFDPADLTSSEVLEVPDPAWFDRMRAALAPSAGGLNP
jgi:catechol 2,3-dioxygenase-like lactoylglutathione lyase family enzyme